MTKDLLTIWRGVIPHRRTMDDIAEPVARAYGLTLAELKGERRAAKFAHPRQEAYAAIMATGNYSSGQVGWYFNKRDGSTVRHGVKAHERRAAVGVATNEG